MQIAFCWLYAAAATAAAAESSSLGGLMLQLSFEAGGARDFKMLIFVEDVVDADELVWEGCWCLSPEKYLPVGT